ncbi:hypothetical protein LTR37_001181 [Vermiconidia calcicola]|uniref:Uncharacterized protein n=1 Tax=Vermiconidia calcicola TaxID=1690605 RepID=A0ACC3NXQ4_9PEZI|nr:hypothetical protein LTR37_001181 [Vermiconidia calcicola]
MRSTLILALAVFTGAVVARNLPENVRAFYHKVNNGKCAGGAVMKDQFYSNYPGSKLYGVWGDTNGDDGPPIVGEASIALATECFGTGITGNNGHDKNDVLYIGFLGSVAQTVNKKADWGAKTFEDFETSIAALGDRLIRKL